MVILDGNHLSIEDVVRVARDNEAVKLSETGKAQVLESNSRLEAILQSDRSVYGINTGFGIFADQRIPRKDSAILSRNLIISHAVGTGPALPAEIVRAAMVVRANTLVKGYSGVRLEVINTILEMLNRGVTPIVPSQGSLGSSGDLCLLSHMALVFTTDPADNEEDSGLAEINGVVYSGKQAMQIAGIPRIELGPKEGLAINNGATFCAAEAALNVYDAQYLCNVAELCLATTIEALQGCSSAFDARLHEARGLRGQIEVAEKIRELTSGSTLLDSCDRIQDAYSLRCAPQVQGMTRDTVRFVWDIIEKEINAATDNPLIFEPDIALSGGNFHGEPVGMAMDFLGIAVAELGAIAERRTYRLTDGKINSGLPAMLVDTPQAAGLNSGLMMPQYTSVSLVLENQTLAYPDSVHSLPTSGSQEDHNANAMTAARHASSIIENTYHILAVELYTAVRALDLRLRLNPDRQAGQRIEEVRKLIRAQIPYRAGDIQWGVEIKKLKEMIINRKLCL